MLKIQLRTAMWSFALLSLSVLLLAERVRHNNEIESLNCEIETLNESIGFAPNYSDGFTPNYSDLEIYVSASSNGRIDDTMIYNRMLKLNQ